MGLSTAPRSSQGVLVSRRSSSRPSGARLSGHCVSGSAGVGRTVRSGTALCRDGFASKGSEIHV